MINYASIMNYSIGKFETAVGINDKKDQTSDKKD
jgi:hypothetical protein